MVLNIKSKDVIFLLSHLALGAYSAAVYADSLEQFELQSISFENYIRSMDMEFLRFHIGGVPHKAEGIKWSEPEIMEMIRKAGLDDSAAPAPEAVFAFIELYMRKPLDKLARNSLKSTFRRQGDKSHSSVDQLLVPANREAVASSNARVDQTTIGPSSKVRIKTFTWSDFRKTIRGDTIRSLKRVDSENGLELVSEDGLLCVIADRATGLPRSIREFNSDGSLKSGIYQFGQLDDVSVVFPVGIVNVQYENGVGTGIRTHCITKAVFNKDIPDSLFQHPVKAEQRMVDFRGAGDTPTIAYLQTPLDDAFAYVPQASPLAGFKVP